MVRFQQKNYDAALKALQQAVKLSPADAFSYSNLGIVYYQMGQFDSAISALEKALAKTQKAMEASLAEISLAQIVSDVKNK